MIDQLEQQRLNVLVFVKYNWRLEAWHQRRKIKGKTYDPISLLDMEYDDEWITKKEDAVFLEDITWMNVSKCFKIEEGESGWKIKRSKN